LNAGSREILLKEIALFFYIVAGLGSPLSLPKAGINEQGLFPNYTQAPIVRVAGVQQVIHPNWQHG
jgi:hypothetical protein